MSRAPHHVFSIEEYLFLEHHSPTKHEFVDGEVFAMAGGLARHSELAMSVGALLRAQLRDRPCRVFGSDLKIRIEEVSLVTYPDVSVVCGDLSLDNTDRWGEMLLNPIVVIEVLSPSTEAYDRGDKLVAYQHIPSLREIVLVSQRDRRIEIWRRDDAGVWEHAVVEDGVAELRSIRCELPLAELYR